jgi:hypothetical protein
VNEKISAARQMENGFWNVAEVDSIARQHLSGLKNFPSELNAALTLESVERQFFRELPRGF